MMILFLLCLAGLIAAMEFLLPERMLRHLHLDTSLDTDLTEPDQPVTLTSCLRNTGHFPLLYAGLAEYITSDVTLSLPEDTEADLSARFGENRVSYTMALPGHREYRTQVCIRAHKRGLYTLGKYFLESGDYLGLRSATRSGEIPDSFVVMPEGSRDVQKLNALGGFLGDVSVQRFLFEDPVLTVGTRDYTGSEPMKAISWNQTARTGRLQAKVYDHTVELTASVILNLDGGTEEELEEALRLTRSVCEELEARRIPYEFFTNGDIRTGQEDLSWLSSGLGRRHFMAIMYGLGASKLLRLDTLSRLVDRVLDRRRSHSVYFLVTAPLNEARQQELDRLRSFSDHEVCVLCAGPAEGGECP